MAGERSIYNKIRNVLDTSSQENFKDIKELQDVIKKHNQPVFFTLQYLKNKRDFKYKISEKSIQSSVELCQELSLLSETGSLTSEGKKALKGENFNQVLGAQIKKYFSLNKIDLGELNDLIAMNFNNDNDEDKLTDSKDLWESIESKAEISRELFSRLVILLGHCGYVKSSQSKIFLGFKI